MKEVITAAIQNSENYTLAVAEAMPEEGYDARPAKEVFTFLELMNHIAFGIEWWTENQINGVETEWNPPAPKEGKEKTIAYIKLAYQTLRDSITTTGRLTDKKIKGLYATLDHITHHRGQATTYLRYKGITPPEYTY